MSTDNSKPSQPESPKVRRPLNLARRERSWDPMPIPDHFRFPVARQSKSSEPDEVPVLHSEVGDEDLRLIVQISVVGRRSVIYENKLVYMMKLGWTHPFRHVACHNARGQCLTEVENMMAVLYQKLDIRQNVAVQDRQQAVSETRQLAEPVGNLAVEALNAVNEGVDGDEPKGFPEGVEQVKPKPGV